MRKFSITTFYIFTFFILFAQSPKREMRAGWMATVYRIDWPTTAMSSVTAANISAQKKEFITILDSVVAANMNAIFFQIRPESDAFYNSAYEPWSAHLGGVRGANPGYDPLAFAIEECHKRGVELHGWLNPYRFETSSKKYVGAVCDYRTLHPEWILDYAVYNTDGSKKTDGITILDPGNPAVRKLIKNVVGDIISKYDIDGIIFDDYFYAYSGTGTALDAYAQNLYKPANMTLSNWRRDNVNKMIADVYDTIQSVKPTVIFGVSPFGIWTTSSTVAAAEGITLPSGITGSNMYEQIYCDPIAWMKQGKVDYISPQLYWTTTSTGQDYKKLCPWWSDVAYKYSKYFYSSMSMTALTSSYKAPTNQISSVIVSEIPADLPELKLYTKNGGLLTGLTNTEKRVNTSTNFDDSEVGLEIDWNRNSTKNAAPGAVLYSIKHLVTNGNFSKYLREQKFTSPALTPAISWKSHSVLATPNNVHIENNILSWTSNNQNIRFSVYAIPNSLVGTAGAFENSAYLLGVSYSNQFDVSKYISLSSTYKFAIAPLDRYGNEFTSVYVTTDAEPIYSSSVQISTHNGNLNIRISDTTKIELYNSQGIMLDSRVVTFEYNKNLKHGVYFIRIKDKTYKIVI